MSARACVLISCWTVRTSISLLRSSLTRRSRAVVSAMSRTLCASSTFSSRFEAERSARRPASSRLAMIAITSGEIFLPRFAAFSMEARTLRTRASTAGARQPLNEDAYAPIREFEHTHDDGHRADLVEVFARRLLFVQVSLRGEQY